MQQQQQCLDSRRGVHFFSCFFRERDRKSSSENDKMCGLRFLGNIYLRRKEKKKLSLLLEMRKKVTRQPVVLYLIAGFLPL